jgi:hypothetical protein
VSATVPHGAANNTCYLCHGAPRSRPDGTSERIIDTGVHIDCEGFIAICETCVTYMGTLLGLYTATDVENLTDELREALEGRVADAARIAHLELVVNSQQVAFAEVVAGLDDNPPAEPHQSVIPHGVEVTV